jgi:alkanesulfonate monooxygenase SsuD/methylene tetrahydromethanopterin reductase-like flavin-dependent oxidoreductase (luciferase family)
VIEALVQAVIATSDRAASIAEISAKIPGASPEDIAHTPFLLIGSYEEMADQLLTQAEELGIASYVVREPAVRDLEQVLSLINR